MGKQTLRQAARLAASEVCAKRRREPAERDRRLEKLAIEVLTALEKEMPPPSPPPSNARAPRCRR
jgi:hypothetical protein